MTQFFSGLSANYLQFSLSQFKKIGLQLSYVKGGQKHQALKKKPKIGCRSNIFTTKRIIKTRHNGKHCYRRWSLDSR